MDDYVLMSDAMLTAKRNNDSEAVYRLLEQGEDPNAEDEDRSPLLGWAAFRGHTEIVRLLLDKGATVNTRGSEGETPLLDEAFNGYTAIVHLLIEHGADINLAERGGPTPLMYAQWRGHKDTVQALLAAGALEDISETPEEKQKERERLEQHTHDLDSARREFLSRPENHNTTKIWAGAWASLIGTGASNPVIHADGAVMHCNGSRTREVAHLYETDDGVLLYRLPSGKTTRIEKWSVTEDNQYLSFNYGHFIATFKRL